MTNQAPVSNISAFITPIVMLACISALVLGAGELLESIGDAHDAKYASEIKAGTMDAYDSNKYLFLQNNWQMVASYLNTLLFAGLAVKQRDPAHFAAAGTSFAIAAALTL